MNGVIFIGGCKDGQRTNLHQLRDRIRVDKMPNLSIRDLFSSNPDPDLMVQFETEEYQRWDILPSVTVYASVKMTYHEVIEELVKGYKS